MKRRDILRSPKLAEMKRRKRGAVLKKLFLSFFAFALLVAGITYASRMESLNIKEVRISGNKIVETAQISEIAQNNLSGHYLWLLPKSNFLIFPEGKIKDELSAQFGRLDEINLKLEKTKKLTIDVTEREGKYTWCGETLPEIGARQEDQPCYFVDYKGYVFDEAPSFSGDVYFRFLGRLEENYLEREIFPKLVAFKDFLPKFGVNPAALLVKPDGDIEIYLASDRPIENSPKIIIKKDFDLEKLSENLGAAMNTDPLKSDFKNKYNSLRYIDLRFGNKVYFKFE